MTKRLLDGDPIEELGRRSRRAALLVLGSRGRGRLASMAFGSVWVTCTLADEVVAVDELTMAVRGRVAVPDEPDGIRVAANGVWVVATLGPTLVHLSAEPDAPKVVDSRKLGDAATVSDSGNDDVVLAGDAIAVSAINAGRVHLTKPKP